MHRVMHFIIIHCLDEKFHTENHEICSSSKTSSFSQLNIKMLVQDIRLRTRSAIHLTFIGIHP